MPNMEVDLTPRARPLASDSPEQNVSFAPIHARKIKFYTTEAAMCMKTQRAWTNCPRKNRHLVLNENTRLARHFMHIVSSLAESNALWCVFRKESARCRRLRKSRGCVAAAASERTRSPRPAASRWPPASRGDRRRVATPSRAGQAGQHALKQQPLPGTGFNGRRTCRGSRHVLRNARLPAGTGAAKACPGRREGMAALCREGGRAHLLLPFIGFLWDY